MHRKRYNFLHTYTQSQVRQEDEGLVEEEGMVEENVVTMYTNLEM